MSAPESYQLESLASDAGKPPSPAVSIDPSNVRWLNQGGRRWEVCKIVCRLFATFFSVIVLCIVLAWYQIQPVYDTSPGWPYMCLPGVITGFLWDLAEFLTICARYGRGITPKALIGVELVIAIGSLFGAAWLAFMLNSDVTSGYYQVTMSPYNIALTGSVCTAASGTIHLFLCIRACIERRREIRRRRPRVMYIPETGQTVYVVAKPFPKLPPWRPQQPAARMQSFPRSPQSAVNNTQRQHVHLHTELPLQPLPDRPGEGSPTPSIIRRKPVPGLPRSIPPGDWERHMRPNMRPPPEDYQPDEAELERMRRGDAQPQLILPGDVDIKFATSITGMTPANADSREGKYRVNLAQMPVPTGESSIAATGGPPSL
ncbi:hypothetical protein CCHL11_02372 [Colletotrichum chlorophyti]|uniref:Uncharacterized protein n=1 Tax=Colletotrichum chlorophyti TaxID=708187 RepID=A0A1Q8S5W1_9PEZI|nr:hypothetical protein CCHL11_02372 [Colletotrichum chlorophyti]